MARHDELLYIKNGPKCLAELQLICLLFVGGEAEAGRAHAE